MEWVLDLDGVVWLGDTPIVGAADAVATLRARGDGVTFVTNNSSATVEEYVAKLAAHGIPAAPVDIVTSAQAVATLVEPGHAALACAGPGVVEALADRGVRVVTEPRGLVDAVVVGWHRSFDFARLAAATAAVLGGARLLATNADATYPTADGLLPGAGAILAAVAFATGTTATVAGKPNQPLADLVVERLGRAPDVVVGDRADTDGLLAQRLGARFALVLTGVTTPRDLPVAPAPHVVADSLAALVDDGQYR